MSPWAGRWAFLARVEPREGALAELAAAGFRGLLAQVEWQDDAGRSGESNRSPARVAAIAAACAEAGLEVGWWGWVAPSGAAAWQRRLDALAAGGAPPPRVLVLDAEPDSGWRGKAGARAAEAYGRVRHPAPLGVTSYGMMPEAMAGFGFCEVAMPQLYDPRGRAAPGFVGRWLDTWRRGLPEVGLVPALGANSTAAPRMAEIAAQAAAEGSPGAAWFSLAGLRGARLAAAAASEIPRGG